MARAANIGAGGTRRKTHTGLMPLKRRRPSKALLKSDGSSVSPYAPQRRRPPSKAPPPLKARGSLLSPFTAAITYPSLNPSSVCWRCLKGLQALLKIGGKGIKTADGGSLPVTSVTPPTPWQDSRFHASADRSGRLSREGKRHGRPGGKAANHGRMFVSEFFLSLKAGG